MKPLMNKFRLCAVVAVAALTAASAFASAPHTPRSLKDLLEKNADWGSEQLRSRGYTRISSDRHHGKVVQYWWSHQKNRCIRAEAWDRDYHSIMTTSSTDCHQYHDEATKDDSSAGVAIAAAAIIGAAVLASSSHHRDDETNQDANATAEFDRGYRDGLHHKGYHNYNSSNAYSNGYQEGQSERSEQTNHHSNNGYHSGHRSYVSLDDLVGARAAGAESELERRGFVNYGGYNRGNKSFATWWNGKTRQCVSAVTKEGHIKSFQNLDEGNCT